jgi:LPS-assembly lipoprotein
MSSSDRRTFLLMLGALPLAGCGYAPAYGPAGKAGVLQDSIEFAAPPTRDAFLFVARLEDRLGRSAAPAYRLGYSLSTYRVDLAVDTSGAILRYNLVGTVDWQLTDATTGAVVLSGREQNFTGSAATSATIQAQAADDDSRGRLMVILADQIVTKLVAGAAGLPSQAG